MWQHLDYNLKVPIFFSACILAKKWLVQALMPKLKLSNTFFKKKKKG